MAINLISHPDDYIARLVSNPIGIVVLGIMLVTAGITLGTVKAQWLRELSDVSDFLLRAGWVYVIVGLILYRRQAKQKILTGSQRGA